MDGAGKGCNLHSILCVSVGGRSRFVFAYLPLMPLAKVWSAHLDNNRQSHTGQDRTGIGSVEPSCIDSRGNTVISAGLSLAAVPLWLPVQ